MDWLRFFIFVNPLPSWRPTPCHSANHPRKITPRWPTNCHVSGKELEIPTLSPTSSAISRNSRAQ